MNMGVLKFIDSSVVTRIRNTSLIKALGDLISDNIELIANL